MESFLTSAGYAALILFGILEAACIPISSEITFGFAGVATTLLCVGVALGWERYCGRRLVLAR